MVDERTFSEHTASNSHAVMAAEIVRLRGTLRDAVDVMDKVASGLANLDRPPPTAPGELTRAHDALRRAAMSARMAF